jgi:predicted ATPase/class 3 adenylate cyclase
MPNDNAVPTGTVSFLYTDIEGSTRLAREYPDAMPLLLARHHEILNGCVSAHGGYVFQVIGDAFCVAFHSAADALLAAVEAQRAFHDEPWDPAPVRVRMAIHTGKADYQGSDLYDGYLTLSHIQRLVSAAHGGQVLLSLATEQLVHDELPAGVTLRDMGERRLKDVARAERIYQLVIPDLPVDFPPIRTLDARRHNLPAQITSFIGREREMAELKRLLAAHRLVTLTGSGGAGKTRLSLEVAAQNLDQFPDGAWLAELAPVTAPDLIPQILLSVFNLRGDSHRPPLEILIDHLGSKSALLLLDNCEHLVEGCARIAEALLSACPRLRVLATSREVLGIAGEVDYRVPSLGTPDPAHLPPLDELAGMDSVRLFLERASAVKSSFRLTPANASFVAQICSRLDGIPLAIELAASRVKALSPEQIASRLDDRFRLLTGGSRTALPRQQTLRATIDWSYSLLSEPEKTLFRRLAVFAGGWTLQAAEQVCAQPAENLDVMELLTRLVEKSLVFTEESTGEIRYRRLETIRQYSYEKLVESDDLDLLRDRHLDFFVQFAESVDENLKGADQNIWQRRMSAELDNLRAALAWAMPTRPDSALRIAGASNLFWTAGGFSPEGFRWTREALDRVESAPLPHAVTAEQRSLARARALRGLTRLYLSLGDNLSARRAAEEAVVLYRRSPDRGGLAFALVILAYPLEFLGERAQAEAALHEAYGIARAASDIYVMCRALNRLAGVVVDLYQDVNLSQAYLDESIQLARRAGLRSQEAQAIEISGVIARHRKDYDLARRLFRQSLEIYEEIGAPFNAVLEKSNLAHLERQLGEYGRALEYYRETIVAFRDIGQMGAVAHQLECFGFIAMARHENERALALFAAAGGLREKSATPMTPDEQRYFDEQLRILRQHVSPARFGSIWSQAGAQTVEQAIQLALSAG